jgi:hypothetical protein
MSPNQDPLDQQLISIQSLFANPHSQQKINRYIDEVVKTFFNELGGITEYAKVEEEKQIFEISFEKDGISKRYDRIFPFERLLEYQKSGLRQYMICFHEKITPHYLENINRYYGTISLGDKQQVALVYYIRFTIDELMTALTKP